MSPSGRDDTRRPARRVLALPGQAASLARLPPPVAWFYLRALYRAVRDGDRWSLAVVTRPREVRAILHAARGRRTALEIGTGTAWTTVALALADRDRRVVSLDTVTRPARERYLALAGAGARSRIVLIGAAGDDATAPAPAAVDLLFIDGSHERADTRAAFETWRGRLATDAVVVFHDYGDHAYPGVAEAVADLGLSGRVEGRCFVWASATGGG